MIIYFKQIEPLFTCENFEESITNSIVQILNF